MKQGTNSQNQILCQLVLGLALILVSVTARADLSDSRIRTSDEMTVMDLTRLNNAMQDQHITSQDIQSYLPTTIKSGSSETQVAKSIADQSLQTWFNSPSVKNSSVGRAANTVQNNMKLDASTKTGKGLEQVEHKFTMQLLAFQTSAKLEYTGYVSAMINHNLAEKQTDVELSEKVLKNKSLFLNHSMKAADRLSTMGLKWNF